MKKSELKRIIKEEIDSYLYKQKINEDLGLALNIVLGVVGSIAGLGLLKVLGLGALMGLDTLKDKFGNMKVRALAKKNRETVKSAVEKLKKNNKFKELVLTLSKQKEGKERTATIKELKTILTSVLDKNELELFDDIYKASKASYNDLE